VGDSTKTRGRVSGKAEKGGRKRKTKDPNAPKRALSAFFHFCGEERPKVKEVLSDATVGEMAKELGRRWNDVTDDVKAKFEALAAKDKQRYEKEMAVYKKGGKVSKAPSPKKGRAEESGGDEEEEEEEEDE